MNATAAPSGYETYEGSFSMWQVTPVVQRHFEGKRLLIAAFDSGTITPHDDEIKIGWRVATAGMLSPPIGPNLSFPSEQFDEWWIFDTPEAAARMSEYDQFVNYGTWTLRSPKEITKDYDPTWERTSWDWIVPHQERFWAMIERYKPLAYLSDGDGFLAVSTDREFIATLNDQDGSNKRLDTNA